MKLLILKGEDVIASLECSEEKANQLHQQIPGFTRKTGNSVMLQVECLAAHKAAEKPLKGNKGDNG